MREGSSGLSIVWRQGWPVVEREEVHVPTNYGPMLPDPADQGQPITSFVMSTNPPVQADPPPQQPQCPPRTFQLKVNVKTGAVDVQGGTQKGATATSSSGTGTTAHPAGGGDDIAVGGSEQGGEDAEGDPNPTTGLTGADGTGQTSGTSVAIRSARQQATTNPDGSTATTTWTVTVKTCYGACCYSLTISGGFDANKNPTDPSGTPGAPTVSSAGP